MNAKEAAEKIEQKKRNYSTPVTALFAKQIK